MANANAPRDANQVPVMLAVDDSTGETVTVKANSSGALLAVASLSNVTVAQGGTGNTTFTAYSVICAGTTATGAFQNVSGVGTSGQVLTSNGAAQLPTWQTSATGTVTSVSVVTANGVSGSVATATTTPAITLTLGAITPTTVNGLTITANGTNTLNIAAGKTLVVSNNITIAGTDGKTLTVQKNLTLDGTDGTTMTFPSTSATVARTDAANTFTGVQTLSSAPILSTGTVTVSGNTVTFPTTADTLVARATTDTLTNKRITKRAPAVTQSATPTINTDVTDVAHITGLAQAITSMTTNLSGTPVEGDTLRIDITDNGTARGITWGASFESSGNVSLPTTTVISTRLDIGFVWNSVTTKWRCVAVA